MKRKIVPIVMRGKDRIRMTEKQLMAECEAQDRNINILSARIRDLLEERKLLISYDRHLELQSAAVSLAVGHIKGKPLFRFKRTAKQWAHWWIGRLYRWSR